MRKIYLLSLLITVFLFQSKAEEYEFYKPNVRTFERLEADTLDNLIAKIGKDSLIHLLDKRIINAKEVVKGWTHSISSELTILELMALNKQFILALDSFYDFRQEYNYSDLPFRLYEQNKKTKDYSEIANYIKTTISKDKNELLVLMYKNIFHLGGKLGFVGYCDIVMPILNNETLDTLYKLALIYPENSRIDFYYMLTQFDKDCGTKDIQSADYRKKLYNSIYPALNLCTAFTDTNEINSINSIKYNLAPKYHLFALGLYAHDFDIKNNQKEIIYFLTSQGDSGEFKDFNIADNSIKVGPNSTVYGLWSLIELREQIDKLYP
ncbi:MAG: hypothetical protein KDC72_00780 [Bacteroidetes bacterium]|nr:hypothetical protein [Bacteroidota bacterium]